MTAAAGRDTKLLIIGLLFIVSVVLSVSCAKPATPEQINNLRFRMEEVMSDFKNLDSEMMQSINEVMTDETDLFDISVADNYKRLKKVMKNMEYEIKNINIAGNNAYLDVTVKNVNMMTLYEEIIMKKSVTDYQGTGELNLDPREMEKEFNKALSKAKKADFSKTVQQTFEYSQGEWIWKMDDDFLDAITGNYFSAYLSINATQEN